MQKKKEVNMIIRPTGNRVLIKIMDEREISPGGIIIPRSVGAFNLPATVGIVEEVGPGYLEDAATNKWIPCSFKKGQKVLINKEAGLKIPKETLEFFLGVRQKDEYVLIQETQIYGTIDEEIKK